LVDREEMCRDGKRYRTLARRLKETTGRRMVKIPLSSGCTCPNRDGTCGVGGCIYCTGRGGGEFAPRSGTLAEQYEKGCRALEQKWPGADRVAYFQSFTNTYCTPHALRALLEETEQLPGVRAVRLATRADCLPEEAIAVLREANGRLPVTLELGLQTANDETARRLNRGFAFAVFADACARAKAAGLGVCIHLINGLPGEDAAQMIESARAAARLRPEGIKIHMLHVLRGSALGRAYQEEPFALLTQEEYVSIVCGQLEVLPPETVIERLTGDGDRRRLLAPDWTRNKRAVLNAIDRELARRDTWQGRLWEESA